MPAQASGDPHRAGPDGADGAEPGEVGVDVLGDDAPWAVFHVNEVTYGVDVSGALTGRGP